MIYVIVSKEIDYGDGSDKELLFASPSKELSFQKLEELKAIQSKEGRFENEFIAWCNNHSPSYGCSLLEKESYLSDREAKRIELLVKYYFSPGYKTLHLSGKNLSIEEVPSL